MLNLLDGPCQGTYMCRRAPQFLRAVFSEDGEKDCLDMIEDTPSESEKVYIYKLEKYLGTVHIHAKKSSGWYPIAEYRYLPNVEGEKLRDNEAWQKWATEHDEK